MAKRKYFLKRVLSVAVSASLIASSANVPAMATESEAETQTETSLEEETEAQTGTEGESEAETQASTEEEVKSEAQTAETESETETQTKTEEKSEEETKAETETQTETESATETEVVEVVEEEEADNVQAEVEEEEADAEGEGEVQETTNLLINGDFSDNTEDFAQNTDSWEFFAGEGGAASAKIEDGALVIDVSNIGTQNWNIQLFQQGLDYEAGDYAVTFKAKASADRPIGVQLQNGDNPAIDGTANEVKISTGEMQEYRVVLNNLATNTNAKLDFPLGAVKGIATDIGQHTITIDDVEFFRTDNVDASATDIDELEKLIDEKITEQGDYTDDTWDVYQSALTEAESVLTGDSIKLSSIYNAIDTIQDAIEGLKTNAELDSIVSTTTTIDFTELDNEGNIDLYAGGLATDKWGDAKATYTVNDNEIVVDCENIGNEGQFWQIQLNFLNQLFEAGASYEMAFDIVSDVNKQVFFKLDNSGIGERTIALEKDVSQNLVITVDERTADLKNNILFALGNVEGDTAGSAAKITISNFTIIEKSSTIADEEREDLQALIDEELDKSKYTTTSWDKYEAAKTAATELLEGEKVTKKDILNEIDKLTSAKNALVLDGLINIMISEQEEQSVVGEDIILTYMTDNADFKFENVDYVVKINGEAVENAELITVDDSAKTIKIDKSLNTEAGVMNIEFSTDAETNVFTPVYQKVYENKNTDDWTLVWQDEFNEDGLDSTKWDHQMGDGAHFSEAGWGNKEEQIYTDSTDNSDVANGKLTITAKKEANGGYTSARLRSVTASYGSNSDEDKKYDNANFEGFSSTYGKIEAKIKLPKGEGVWPAFWMLPTDSEYGTWAASGEIDIMEARGRLADEVCGTIHYGGLWPNNTNNGNTYVFDDDKKDDSITDYHIYTVEWDPGKITWLIDGVEYATITNWYSESPAGDGNWSFPAPFDEDFHILFNLAVGGTFDSGATKVEVDENGVQMDVDYVRWYQRDEETYKNAESNTKVPTVDKDTANESLLKPVDETTGNLLYDPDFADMDMTIKDGGDPAVKGWIPLHLDTGKATWTKQDDGLKVDVTNKGGNAYSVQMLQHMPLVKGYSYEISYTAHTDSTNPKADITVQMGGDEDNAWAKYSPNFSADLTVEPQKFVHKFTMSNATDATARLELNLATSTGNVYLSDFCIKQIEITEDDDQDNSKEPLANGNHVYNGGFNVGSDGLLYWHWTGDDAADVVVNQKYDDKNIRVAKVNVSDETVTLLQKGINVLANDEYELTFDVDSTADQTLVMSLTNADGTKEYSKVEKAITTDTKSVECVFENISETDDEAVLNITFEKTAEIDSVSLIRTTNNNVDFDSMDIWPLYNGDFFNGKDGWNIWSEGKGYISADVNAAGQLEAKITMSEGAQFYHAGMESSAMNLTKGLKYRVKFDYELESDKNYTLKMAGEERKITLEAGKHTYISEPFIADGSGTVTFFFGPDVTKEYTLLMDNIEVYLDADSITVPEGYAKPVSLATSGQYRAGNAATVLFTDNATWEAAEKEYYINGEKIEADKVSIDTEKNTITVDGSLLPAEGKYTIKVSAEGFTDTKAISLTVLSATNWVVNGDFSKGLEGWGTYFQNGCGTAEVNEAGEVVVKHNWNEGSDWHIQLYQENIQYEAGDYVLTFDAWSDVARPIGVQLQNGNNVVSGTANTVALSTEKQTFKLVLKNLAANSEVKLDFPMGNVTLGDLVTPNGEGTAHNIYLDNVVLRPATEDDLNTQPATITLSGATTLGQSVDVSYATDSANDKWLAANKTVYVNGTAVAADKVTFKEDNTGFTIAGDVFTAVGRYEIYVVAEGFDATNKISKNIIGTDGELIFDGDLTNAASWGIHNEDVANLSNGAIVDGVYNLDYKSGSYHSEWGCWITWSSQLIKENISINEDGKYELKFKASTDLTDGRDIIIEYGTEKQKTVHIAQGEAKEYMVELDLTATDAQAIKFLVGPVGANLQLDTTNAEGANTVPHKLTVDDISLKAASEGSGTVTVDKSALQTLVDAQDKKEADYTAESWKAYSEALTAAKAVLEKADATADEVAAAKTALETAIAGLVKASTGDTTVDKSALKTLVDAQDKKEADYTAESWKAYSEALANAKAVLDKADATAEEVAAAKAALETAIAGLVKKPVERQGLWGVIVGYAENEKAVYGYTGSAIKPEVKVYNGNDLLVEKKDYTVKYSDNINAGTAKIEITGKGNFVDTKTIEFTIDGKDINTLDVDNLYALMDANGSVKEPKLAVKDGKKKLVDGKDYTYTIASYKNAEGKAVAGSYDVIITGKDNYKGTKTIKFDVLASNTPVMAKAKITMTPNKVSYSDYISGKYNPTVTVKIGKEKGYVKDTDFTVVCPTDISAGKVAVTVVGKDGKIYGSKDVMINVEGVKLGKNITVEGIAATGYDYTGAELKVSNLVLKDGADKLEEGRDYSVEYSKNVTPGKAKVVITGKGKYTGKLTKTFKINKVAMTNAAIKVDCASTAAYSKAGARPEITVTYNGMTLVEKKDYTVTCKNNKKVGDKATLVITGKGNYSGKLEKAEAYTVTVPTADAINASVADIYKKNNMTFAKFKKAVKVKVTEASTGKALKAKKDYAKEFKLYVKEGDNRIELTEEAFATLAVGVPVYAEITLAGSYAEEGKETKVEAVFKLYDKKAGTLTVEAIDPQTYTGKAVEPKPVVKDGTTVLKEGVDYKLTYSKNIKKGTAKVTITGIGNGYGGSKTVKFKIEAAKMTW